MEDSAGTNIYAFSDMLYILDRSTQKVIGLSLRDIDYMGKDRKKMFAKIYGNVNNNLITLDGDVVSWEIRNALRNYNYVIPYLFE